MNEVGYCLSCDRVKPIRAHHCRSCNRCIWRMDHHCPWIANCVGRSNHKFFLLFLLYTSLGSLALITSFIIYFYLKGFPTVIFSDRVIVSLGKIPEQVNLPPFDAWLFICGIFALSFGFPTFCLFIQQLLMAAKNVTAVEEAKLRRERNVQAFSFLSSIDRFRTRFQKEAQ